MSDLDPQIKALSTSRPLQAMTEWMCEWVLDTFGGTRESQAGKVVTAAALNPTVQSTIRLHHPTTTEVKGD